MNKVFEYINIDVSTTGVFFNVEITSIHILFIVDYIDLHVSIFNEETGYHIIHDFCPPWGSLRKLSSEIRGAKYHDKG